MLLGLLMSIGELDTVEDFRGWRLLSPAVIRRPLTPREREIIDLVGSGQSHKEIGFDLGISSATVRVLYARAMRKLGRFRATPI